MLLHKQPWTEHSTDVKEKAGVANERWGYRAWRSETIDKRWLAGHLRIRNFRQESSLFITITTAHSPTLRSCWCHNRGMGRDRRHMGRLRSRWLSRSICSGLREVNPITLRSRAKGDPSGVLSVSRGPKSCAVTGPAGGRAIHLFHNSGFGTFQTLSVKAGSAEREGILRDFSSVLGRGCDGWLD